MSQIVAPNNDGSVLQGGPGDDTIVASYGPDTLTGGGGNDTFKFTVAPWNAGEVTDFTIGQDKVDISAILHSDGYSGTNPIADGWLYLTDDGQGGTIVSIDQDGPGTFCGWADMITDLKGVSPASLQLSRDFAFAWTGPSTASPPGSGGPGQVITAPNDNGSTLTGTAGDDTLIASHAGDTLTGGAGKDVFQLPYAPNSPVHVTDFTPGTDVLDLRALAPNYHGTDPLNDGYLDYGPDGNGGTIVWLDPDGSGPQYRYYAVDLEGVGWNNLKVGQDILLGDAGSSSGSTSGGSTGGTSGGSTGGTSGSGSGGSTSGGQLIVAPDDSGHTLVGGTGNDTLVASHGPDVLTGNAGADQFRIPNLPWSTIHVTDFTPGQDQLDLSGLAPNYQGTNPVADGYLSFSDDGSGGTDVWVNPNGPSSGDYPWHVADLQGVAPSSIEASRDVLFGQSASTSGGSTGTTGSGGSTGTGGSTGSTGSSGSTGSTGSAGDPNSSANQTITAPNDSGSTLTGGSGNDTLIASHGADVLTGGGGADSFQFPVLPWSAGHVTDFTPGTDVLDLRPLFQAAGYHGTDPVADGYLSFGDDGAGDTQVFFNPHDGSNGGWGYLVTTLDHVAPSNLQPGHDWLFA